MLLEGIRTWFRIGLRAAALPRGHGSCWRRSRRAPCLIRSVRAAAVLALAERVAAAAEAALAERVAAVAEAALAVLAAAPAVAEQVAVAAAAPAAVVAAVVRAERVVAVAAAEQEAAPEAGASIPIPITTTLPTASRERSCRSFQLRLRRISRFLLR